MARGYSYGNRQHTRPTYIELSDDQTIFLEMVYPLMTKHVETSSMGETTIKVIKKNLRNNNYKEADKRFLNFARTWYKNYLVMKKEGTI